MVEMAPSRLINQQSLTSKQNIQITDRSPGFLQCAGPFFQQFVAGFNPKRVSSLICLELFNFIFCSLDNLFLFGGFSSASLMAKSVFEFQERTDDCCFWLINFPFASFSLNPPDFSVESGSFPLPVPLILDALTVSSMEQQKQTADAHHCGNR